MNTLTKEEVSVNKVRLLQDVKLGAVFVYPTDTIYGIGCSALDSKAVQKVRKMKKRQFMPFSVLVPSKDWIKENCIVTEEAEQWLKKLPGPYTLILKLKNKNAIVPEVNNNLRTVGVRIPKHWFSDFVEELEIPILTTSANVKGGDFMTELEDLDTAIKSHLDFIVYEGPKRGKPSTLVDLSKKEPKLTER
ncbi:threonylcarbamoyl-AMP synthase [Candidatus Woesearchaeota archaeon]|nr:threonylcarbamoyl-AMP synthase [Candidatus Woesearchaeota archaeon]